MSAEEDTAGLDQSTGIPGPQLDLDAVTRSTGPGDAVEPVPVVEQSSRASIDDVSDTARFEVAITAGVPPRTGLESSTFEKSEADELRQTHNETIVDIVAEVVNGGDPTRSRSVRSMSSSSSKSPTLPESRPRSSPTTASTLEMNQAQNPSNKLRLSKNATPKDISVDDGLASEDEEEDVVIRPRSRSKRVTMGVEDDEEQKTTKKSKFVKSSEVPIAQVVSVYQPESNEDDDEEGNMKVDQHGALIGNRTYTSRAFRLPMRGDTFFFLATEIARVSGYRDSYLLFNKNRNLKKLMTTEAEKAFLIQQELIPYSYRNRQIGVVRALDIYKTFGARVIAKGMRVKDDYYSQRARDQGFTENDYANEDDRPVGDRLYAQAEASKRTDNDADLAMTSNAKDVVEYNAMINDQRKARGVARQRHFARVIHTQHG